MSCSSESTKPARSPAKPSFAQTCNLLSQYLKEKGSFGDLSLGMTCNVEANAVTPQVPPSSTMNLFPVDNKSTDVCGRTVTTLRNLRSMDLFPQQAGLLSPTVSKDDGHTRFDSSVANMKKFEPQTAQMTIFYGGQVIVLNDFPADKAKEIMLLASKSNSQNNSFNPTPFTSSTARSPIESSIGVPPSPIAVQPSQQPVPGGLPIARRASLHRFLEKRKDRITAKAPYPIASSVSPPPPKSRDSMSWLGLAAQSPL